MGLKDFVLGVGDEARKKAEEKIGKKTNYVKLKDGESIRGFMLTADFVCYLQHGDFQKKIRSHTCKDPLHGKECLSCQHGVKRSKKTIVPFWNVDTKQVEIFDASTTAVKGIYTFLDQYEEDALYTPIALTRSGVDKATTYTVMPVRVRANEKALFVRPDDIVIDEEFYMDVLNIPDDDYVKELLGIEDEENITSLDDTAPMFNEEDIPF